jgi:DNA ligase (NAD+)
MQKKNLTYTAIKKAIEAKDETKAKQLLETVSTKYYEDGSSELLDAEYDGLVLLYEKQFETSYNSIQRLDRTTSVRQDYPLLSGWLGKVLNEDELSKWYETNIEPNDFVIGSPKWDGCSIVISYDAKGNIIRALTRGEEGLGMDVTRAFVGEKHWKRPLGVPGGVKYELVMRWSDLERMNAELSGNWKNPRNTVAGSISSTDSKSRRPYMILMPLDAEWKNCSDDKATRIDALENYYGLMPNEMHGHKTLWNWWWTIADKSEAILLYNCISKERVEEPSGERSLDWEIFEFMIDGIVLEIGNPEGIERHGGPQNDRPSYSIAAKFPPLEARTTAKGIRWDLGNSGRLTPVIEFDPVFMNGNTYANCSISNMLRFDALKLGVGTPLVFELRGEILGYLTRGGADPKGTTPFPGPDADRQDVEFTYNDTGQRVFAYTAAPLAGRCENLLIKCGIKGIKIETLAKLCEAGVLQTLGDIWRLPAKEKLMAKVEGLGDISANGIAEAIQSKLSDGVSDWEVLASVGINSIGRTISKACLKTVTLQDLMGGMARPQLLEVLTPVVGPGRAEKILDGVIKYKQDLVVLVRLTLPMQSKGLQSKYAGPFYKVVVTGDLQNWEREEFKSMIEDMGHKMVGSVSSKTNYLITNSKTPLTTKLKRANELNIPIINESEAIQLLGLKTTKSSIKSQVDDTISLKDL